VDWPGVGLTAAEGVLVLLVTYLLARLARRVSRRASRGARMDVQLVLLVGRLVYIGVLVLGFFAFLDVVAPQYVAPVLGAVGLLGLAFGLAFQDVLKNWISGFFLLLERPFQIGDNIKVGSWNGRVETVRLRVTELRAIDGEKIMVPNQEVYTSAIVNQTSYPVRRFVSTAKIPDGADLRGMLTARPGRDEQGARPGCGSPPYGGPGAAGRHGPGAGGEVLGELPPGQRRRRQGRGRCPNRPRGVGRASRQRRRQAPQIEAGAG